MGEISLNDHSLNPQNGKYKGVQMANVPAWYLLWLNDQSYCRQDVKAYINKNMDVLLHDQKQENKKRNY